MSKKVSYMTLLKEAISDAEHDTAKSVDVKGPMLDPILSYSGGGELPTHKDAASILERYYFHEDEDTGVTVEAEDAEEKEEEKVEEKMAGDVQGDVKGLAASDNEVDAVPGKDPGATKKDIEDEIKEELDAVAEADEDAGDEEDTPAAEVETEIAALENSVIEKLIAEMEEEEDEEEVEEANRVAGDRGAQGEEAMGTNNHDDQVPPRKDATNEADDAKPFAGKETEEEEAAEEEATKDRDKEIKEVAGVGPGPMKAGKGKLGEDGGGVGEDPIEEAFRIFKEEIEDDEDVAKIDSDEVQA